MVGVTVGYPLPSPVKGVVGMYYYGKDWGLLRAMSGHHADGRPALCFAPCVRKGLPDMHKDWFCITLERFLQELRYGSLCRINA
jgi:hypothetical protein